MNNISGHKEILVCIVNCTFLHYNDILLTNILENKIYEYIYTCNKMQNIKLICTIYIYIFECAKGSSINYIPQILLLIPPPPLCHRLSYQNRVARSNVTESSF